MTSHNGFRWPYSGQVEAPDWDPRVRCGGGLHGLLRGVGDWRLLSEGLGDHGGRGLGVGLYYATCPGRKKGS